MTFLVAETRASRPVAYLRELRSDNDRETVLGELGDEDRLARAAELATQAGYRVVGEWRDLFVAWVAEVERAT